MWTTEKIQKIMIPQVIQQIFCEMIIGGRKIVIGDVIFEVTNIRNTKLCQRNTL